VVPVVPGVLSLPPPPPLLDAATPTATRPAPIARPVPTVTPPAIGVDKVRGSVLPGAAAAFAGAVSAAINGRLKEVMRAKASSFFMIMLLERIILEGYWARVLQ
jgi:hypothetical protein